MFSSKRVRDTASGMRVVRRSSLAKLLPLPDGLHFTPAMSARAILRDDVKIVEVPMPYHEREGESKLRIGKDGLRFLRVILEATFLYRPSRPLGIVGSLLMLGAISLMVGPTISYLQLHSVREGLIYRMIVSHLLGTSGLLLLCASYLSRKMVDLTIHGRPTTGLDRGLLGRFFNHRFFWTAPVLLITTGGLLVARGFLQRVRTGNVLDHWSRFIVMSVLVEVAVILLATRAVDYILGLVQSQLAYLKNEGSSDGQ
jgi:hypothetical protein